MEVISHGGRWTDGQVHLPHGCPRPMVLPPTWPCFVSLPLRQRIRLTGQRCDEYRIFSRISHLAYPPRQSTRKGWFRLDMSNHGSHVRNLRNYLIPPVGDASTTKTARTDLLQTGVAQSTICFGCSKFLGQYSRTFRFFRMHR
jgi:hypothetical protein